MLYVLNIVLNKDCSHVLMQLKDRSIYAGKYNFTGGKVKPLETHYDAALRELREETGITRTRAQTDGRFTWLGRLVIPHDCFKGHENDKATLDFFAVTIDEDIPKQQPGETEPLEWMPVENLLNLRHQNMLAGDGELEYFLGQAIRTLKNQ